MCVRVCLCVQEIWVGSRPCFDGLLKENITDKETAARTKGLTQCAASIGEFHWLGDDGVKQTKRQSLYRLELFVCHRPCSCSLRARVCILLALLLCLFLWPGIFRRSISCKADNAVRHIVLTVVWLQALDSALGPHVVWCERQRFVEAQPDK